MSTGRRLTEAFETALEIPFDDSSKFIFFSDIHRGDNSWADDFAHNQNIFHHALKYYYKKNFTYIEIGDSDELWENRKFPDVRQTYSHIFTLIREFYLKNRLYLIYGNHDNERKNPNKVKNTLYRYYDLSKRKYEPLLEGIEVHEGLLLRYSDTGGKIFLVHGHQGDLINDRFWWFGRFLDRFLWRQLQLLGLRDPTRPAKNFKKQKAVEKKITRWVEKNNQMIIAGHTHRPRLPDIGAPKYFNSGSCVHPRSITGIEIENGEIALIKWFVKSNSEGVLYISREVLVEPKKLCTFLKQKSLS
jgi:UDP-2,3-diacylglucosamine pyrophosphatase LpxH